jgi:hypothetical protein
MAEIVKKEVCECHNCGNEAEMVVTCSLPDEDEEGGQLQAAEQKPDTPSEKRVKGTATCSQCGNESEMWIDL